ncbi:chemotaxis protein CheX [Paenisporosarcina quisquiliarum]|jgi:chemotaxis protein CheX|uniref:chemotaxis protein CheX n=1 Tax=Psychrobacillus TaxID=1221880 RepID=UPI0008B083E7|nr:chemotaxis protein CheX [Psychrobacillus psychrodurans]MCK1998121.1 chemotaxis protein CheX [Psychrobacillus psychrodurans]SEM07066.1 chemotaxis protein CheX [Paenisporosarcina quisquiliarum]
MSASKHIQTILNGTIQSLKSVIPIAMDIKSPSLMVQPFEQKEMGVLIGIIGDIKGRIIIDSSAESFSAIGATMFGMPLEGEMLESFTGELGNMVAGNICTSVAGNGVEIDITPPTVIVGTTRLFGFQHAFKLPVEIENVGEMTIILTIDE